MANSASRTAFHYQSESGYIGDPLTFVWNGEYHVFFQYHPWDGPDWNPWLTGTAHWGHTVVDVFVDDGRTSFTWRRIASTCGNWHRSDGPCVRRLVVLAYERVKEYGYPYEDDHRDSRRPPEGSAGNWETIRSLAYEGHGG